MRNRAFLSVGITISEKANHWSRDWITSQVCKYNRAKVQKVSGNNVFYSQKKKRPPGKRCVIMFCIKTNDDGVSLHKFPKDVEIQSKWNSFVLTKRDPKTWTTGTGHIWSDHFKQDDYEGYGSRLSGFTSKLLLKKSSVPSIQATPTPEELEKARQQRKCPSLSSSSFSTNTNVTPRKKRKSRAVSKLTCSRVSVQ